MSAIARDFGVPAYAVVPVHLWPGGPAIVSISAARIGELTEDDLAVLGILAIVAGAAAYRTPLERTRASRALDQLGWHQEVLESIARGAPLAETLRRVCLEVESLYESSRCSVLLVDACAGVLHHAAAPSLPPSFWAAIDGLAVAAGAGACGTAAATAAPVVVYDVFTDARTIAFTDVAVRHDLRSVWAYPLLDSKAQVVGTFAVYRTARTDRTPRRSPASPRWQHRRVGHRTVPGRSGAGPGGPDRPPHRAAQPGPVRRDPAPGARAGPRHLDAVRGDLPRPRRLQVHQRRGSGTRPGTPSSRRWPTACSGP